MDRLSFFFFPFVRVYGHSLSSEPERKIKGRLKNNSNSYFSNFYSTIRVCYQQVKEWKQYVLVMGPAIRFLPFSSYLGSASVCQTMSNAVPTLIVNLAQAWKWFGKLLKEIINSLNFISRFYCVSLLKYLLISQIYLFWLIIVEKIL